MQRALLLADWFEACNLFPNALSKPVLTRSKTDRVSPNKSQVIIHSATVRDLGHQSEVRNSNKIEPKRLGMDQNNLAVNGSEVNKLLLTIGKDPLNPHYSLLMCVHQ